MMTPRFLSILLLALPALACDHEPLPEGADDSSRYFDGVDVADNPVTEGDFFATVYTTLGIDPRAENYQGSRPIPLAPFGSKVVKDLLV